MLFKDKKEDNPQQPTQGTSYPVHSDRRYLPRWEVDNRILYRKEDEISYHECRSKDIHCAGACIRTNEEIPLNQELALTVHLADDIEPVHVHGKAVWQIVRNLENLVGIQFDRINDKTSEQIFHYAFEYKKEELMKLWFKGS